MEKIVSAADANRRFSDLLRGVRKGRTYVVTIHGRPVAKLIPAKAHERNAMTTRAVLLTRLKSQPVAKSKKMGWTRDELYEK